MTRYGIRWPDGSYTGGITDSLRFAQHYAREHAGTVYAVGSPEDPEAP